MNKLHQKCMHFVGQLYKHGNSFRSALPHLWYGTNKDAPTSEEQLRGILQQTFPEAKTIKVEDVSGGCGAMYNIYVETKDFKGLSIAKQHRAIYTALNEQIKLIHGLHVVTKVPPE